MSPQSVRCSATSKQSGERCRRWAAPGQRVCASHGAKSPQARRKAQERLARQRAERAMRALGLGGQVDVDPLDALLGVVRSAAAMVEVYRALVADLALSVGEAVVELPADDEWEMPEVSHRPGIVGFDHLGDPRPHPFVALFNEALDRLARVSKLALDAGVEQRRLKVEQAQAEMVVTAIRATFAHFNVNIDAAELAAFMAAQLRLHEPAALSAPIDAEVVG